MGCEQKYYDRSQDPTLKEGTWLSPSTLALLAGRVGRGKLPYRWTIFSHGRSHGKARREEEWSNLLTLRPSRQKQISILSNPLSLFRRLGLYPDTRNKFNLERMIQCSPGRLLPARIVKCTSSNLPPTSALRLSCLSPHLWPR